MLTHDIVHLLRYRIGSKETKNPTASLGTGGWRAVGWGWRLGGEGGWTGQQQRQPMPDLSTEHGQGYVIMQNAFPLR